MANQEDVPQQPTESTPSFDEQFQELQTLLAAERPPEQPSLVYLFGQTADNESSVLAVANAYHERGVPIAFIGHDNVDPISGYPGFLDWQQKLKEQGIPLEGMQPIRGTTYMEEGVLRSNTYTEAEALVEHARNNNLSSVVVIAPDFHLVRAFTSVVSFALQRYPELKVYAKAGAALPSNEVVTHSQGVVQATREELPAIERERFEIYHRKGDLVSPGEVVAYIKRRDTQE